LVSAALLKVALAFAHSALAAPPANHCADPAPEFELQRFPVPSNVNFFVRSSPATGEVGIATSDGNLLLDVKTGKFQKVPGLIDPVLSPDGNLLTTPETWVYNPKTKELLTEDQAEKLHKKGHVAFGTRFMLHAGRATEWLDVRKGKARETDLTEEQLRAKGVKYAVQNMSFYKRAPQGWELIAQDKDSETVYQSVGELGKTANGGTAYRLLVEGDGGLFTRDYELAADGKTLTFGPPAKAVCGGYHGTLPVLDKSGTEFTSFDPEHGATKVISIGAAGDQCVTKESIPLILGKTDFSPSRRRLAFHLTLAPGAGGPPVPGRAGKETVYIYDLDAHAVVPVPAMANEDAYYPVFLSDDKIAFVSAADVKKGKKGRKNFLLNVFETQELPLFRCAKCYEGNSNLGQAAALLGALKIKSCTPNVKPGFAEAMAAFGGLSELNCIKLLGALEHDLDFIPKTVANLPRPGVKGESIWDGGRENESWNVETLRKMKPGDLLGVCNLLAPPRHVQPFPTDMK
jgi:hypothetical protein